MNERNRKERRRMRFIDKKEVKNVKTWTQGKSLQFSGM
jgi:hypothetical protein